MKKRWIAVILTALAAILLLTSCGDDISVNIKDGKIEGIDQLPVQVEVTGLEGVSGKAKVDLLTETQQAEALAAVKDVYYVADGAETYAVDIKIVDDDGKEISVGKPVTVNIALPNAKLPLDLFVVFHIHDGKAEEIKPTVANGKLTFTVESFSPFLIIPAHVHSYGEWEFIDGKEPACGEAGIQKRTCACGDEQTRDYTAEHIDEDHDGKCDKCGASMKESGEITTPDHEHEFGAWEIVTKPTCTEPGLKERKCKCGFSETETINALGGEHIDNDKDGKCDKCGASMKESGDVTTPDEPIEIPATYKKVGTDTIYFGSYPQTRETDETIINALNTLAGGTPGRTDNDYGWISYKYYHGTGDEHMRETTNEDDYMWYKDVTYQGVKYRGVYFIQFRPDLTVRQIGQDKSYAYKPTNTWQYNNGYRKTVAYWFRYEPIEWRILEEKNGSALLIAKLIIDSQAYLNVAEYVGLDSNADSIYMNTNPGVPADTYANNYMYSYIRAWLNETFYNTAFTELQKGLIALTTVDNGITSSYSTNENDIRWNKGTKYLCQDTADYLFLPSQADISNPDYGFKTIFDNYCNDKNRIRKYSDYALSQGLHAHGSVYTDDELYGEYWLRSPREENDGGGYGEACAVDEEGDAAYSEFVVNTSTGVVPMLWLNLSAE